MKKTLMKPAFPSHEEALAAWYKYGCDGRCNKGSDVCACDYSYPCPGCNSRVAATGEDITDMIRYDKLCVGCFCGDNTAPHLPNVY